MIGSVDEKARKTQGKTPKTSLAVAESAPKNTPIFGSTFQLTRPANLPERGYPPPTPPPPHNFVITLTPSASRSAFRHRYSQGPSCPIIRLSVTYLLRHQIVIAPALHPKPKPSLHLFHLAGLPRAREQTLPCGPRWPMCKTQLETQRFAESAQSFGVQNLRETASRGMFHPSPSRPRKFISGDRPLDV